MRAVAFLSAVAVAASLAVVGPGSMSEGTAAASTTACVDTTFYQDALASGNAEPLLNGGVYEIGSAANLVYVSVNQDSGNPKWRTRSLAQTAPIDLEGCLFTPIGLPSSGLSGSFPFTGKYDGQHYPVRHLSVTRDGHAGLFGETQGALITRIALEHVNITVNGSGFDSGSLIGQANSTTVSHSYATGTISSIGSNVGGLVGGARNGTVIENSFSSVSVTRTTSGNVFGGLVGVLSGSTINNSYSAGGVSGGDGNNVGGLVGQVAETSTISHSYSRGAVTGADSVGGLIGFLANPTTLALTNSYATGEVTGTTSNVGGLVGGKAPSGVTVTVNNSFWDTTTTRLTTTLDNQGAGRNTDDMTSIATFTDTTSPDLDQAWPIVEGWQSFDPNDEPARVWGIRSDLNSGYPFLLWEYESTPDFPCGAFVNGVYQVSTAEHLAKVGSGGTTQGAACGLGDSYEQTADIQLSGVWAPLAADGFTGEFDGGEFSITGLTLDPADQTLTNQGLFALIGIGGVVTNVSLIDVSLETDNRRRSLGALAGGNRGTISNSSATGSLQFGSAPPWDDPSDTIGGLVGRNEGAISGSVAQVTISEKENRLADSAFIGGLVGEMWDGSITDSHATGHVEGYSLVGGLVGEISGGSISDSFATGTVKARGDSGGGLIGLVWSADITNSFATGEVNGGQLLGGLVGWLDGGTIHQSWATGSATPDTDRAGGLVGMAEDANISESWSAGNVSAGREFAGGLVGFAESVTITDSHATGNVSGDEFLGGLVGGAYVESVISRSSAEGDVSGRLFVGGLAGQIAGTIEYSYATGKVEGTQEIVGGLVGALGNTGAGGSGTVHDSYATGQVDGGNSTGGLIGWLFGGTLTSSYSTGKVTGGDDTGGLVGEIEAGQTVTASFWDTNTSSQQTGAAGIGKSTDELQALNTFAAANWAITDGWEPFSPPELVWGICGGGINSGYPFLLWQFGEHPCAPTPEPGPGPDGESGQQLEESPGTTSSGSATSSTGSSRPPSGSQEDSLGLTPSRDTGLSGTSSPATANQNTSDTPTDPDGESPAVGEVTTDEEAAGGDTVAVEQTADDQGAVPSPRPGGTGWLWAIGLGGLGAAALIAGGVAFARTRP